MVKTLDKRKSEIYKDFDIQEDRWNDPVSLAALEECKRIEANPENYKSFRTTAELFADLDSDDDNDE